MTARLALTGFLLALVLALATCAAPDPTSTPVPTPTVASTATPVPGERQEALVLRVVDGDTIVVDLAGKQYSVRYIGVDTPETHHPTDGADYWGFEATEANRSMVKEGETVVLQRDISETDIYDRLLRYVWVRDTLVNAELVRMGLARVLFYEPDVLYEHEIKEAEREAQAARRGLYGPLPTPPAEKPLLYKGTAWMVAPSGDTVALWHDPARGDSGMAFPGRLKVRVVDAFWVPETQEWWYWVGPNGFNGWVTGEYITREIPGEAAPGPPATWNAYDWLTISGASSLHVSPFAASETTGELAAGTPVQIKELSWESGAGAWWYYVESTEGQGWVQSDRLEK